MIKDNIDDAFYLDHDSIGEGTHSTHIMVHAIIIFKNNFDSENIGIALCNNGISYHGGIDTNNKLELEFLDDGICPVCVREYKEEMELKNTED